MGKQLEAAATTSGNRSYTSTCKWKLAQRYTKENVQRVPHIGHTFSLNPNIVGRWITHNGSCHFVGGVLNHPCTGGWWFFKGTPKALISLNRFFTLTQYCNLDDQKWVSLFFKKCPKIRRFLLASLALAKSHGIPRTRKCLNRKPWRSNLEHLKATWRWLQKISREILWIVGSCLFFWESSEKFWHVLGAESAGIKINIEAGGATKLMPKLVICGIPQFLHNVPVFFFVLIQRQFLATTFAILILMYYLIYYVQSPGFCGSWMLC